MRLSLLVLCVLSLGLAGCLPEQNTAAPSATFSTEPTPQMIALGSALFNDTNLSSQKNQSCASCHDKSVAFADADKNNPTSKGSVSSLFGTRNTPSIAYSAFTPALHQETEDGETLWKFLNPIEMNNKDAADVIAKLRTSPTANLFREIFGGDALDVGKEDQAFTQLAQAIATFERTPEFSPFSSKFDFYIQGKVQFTTQEIEGMSLFIRADKGNCAACHPVTRSVDGTPPLFTDFSYDNVGVSRHPNTQFFATDFVDEGLAQTTNNPNLRGQFRVATLRNIAKTAPYMHNGRFDSLRVI